mgnify:CR=1 FL=1
MEYRWTINLTGTLPDGHTPDLTITQAIAHHVAGLSVYLGHASVANTYWYLEATPVLLRDIAATSEQLFLGEAA